MVEFGLIATLLFTFLIGIIYGGIMAYDRVVLTNAVANGARTLASELGSATACTDATNEITATAYGLNTSSSVLKIAQQQEGTVTGPAAFISNTGSGYGTSSCDVTSGTNPYDTGVNCTSAAPCQILNGGEYAVIAASYPCSMSFPRLGINLCPMTETTTTITYPPGQTGTGTISITVSCPSPPCIYAIESARISGNGTG